MRVIKGAVNFVDHQGTREVVMRFDVHGKGLPLYIQDKKLDLDCSSQTSWSARILNWTPKVKITPRILVHCVYV